jgi:hypothetical protein
MAIGAPVPIPERLGFYLLRYFNDATMVETLEVVDGSELLNHGDTMRRELRSQRKSRRKTVPLSKPRKSQRGLIPVVAP